MDLFFYFKNSPPIWPQVRILDTRITVLQTTVVDQSITDLAEGRELIFDANVFASVFLLCRDGRSQKELMVYRAICFGKCTGCLRHKRVALYLDEHTEKDKTIQMHMRFCCSNCRRKQPPAKIPHLVYTNICVDVLSDMYDQLTDIHQTILSAATLQELPILVRVTSFNGTSFGNEDDGVLVHKLCPLREEFEQRMISFITSLDEYGYETKYSQLTNSMYACKQSARRKNSTNERKRLRYSERIHECHGSVNFVHKRNNVSLILIKHKTIHENYNGRTVLDNQSKTDTAKCAEEGLVPYQIKLQLVTPMGVPYTYSQVYYEWHK